MSVNYIFHVRTHFSCIKGDGGRGGGGVEEEF